MTIPFVCVFVAFLLCMATKLPVALAMYRKPGGYDNRHPRDQQSGLEGWGRRAVAAHLNSFEAFPGFAAAVVIAHLASADPVWSSWFAVVFVTSRIAYISFYLANSHVLRSLVWSLGWGATVLLFVASWLA
ncbi:MAG: MAPEG family protein [bacterium]|nr:MAPEG family protein [bacterium]